MSKPLPDGSPNPQVANLFAADGKGVLFLAAVSTTEHEGDFGDVVDRVDAELFQTADEIRDAFPDAIAEVGSSGLLVAPSCTLNGGLGLRSSTRIMM